MHEIEEQEQEHPIIPNTWVYHKDSDLDEVLNYIKQEYESLIKFDEMEEDIYK